MALNTKEEKIILLKDLNNVNKAIIEKGITAPNSEKVLSILKDNASTDVITSLANYDEFFNHITTPGFKPWIQKALFIKDMQGKSLPINPAEPTILTKFGKGESAIVYMDDTPTAFNGNGRPHFLKFMADTTLKQIGITFVSTYSRLNTEPNNAWYFVEDMAGYGEYGSYESALVYKWNSSFIETWKSDDSDLVPGDELWRLHNLAVQDITPGATAPTAGSEAIFAWGDLSDTAQRKTFMDKALVGQWGTAQIAGDRYLFNVKTKPTAAGSTAVIGGFRFVNGANGWSAEFVEGRITELNVPNISTGSFTGDAFSSSLNLPAAYTALQYLPKDVILQMILDYQIPVVQRTFTTLLGNQVEIKLDGGKIVWRHGDHISTTLNADGHPIDAGMKIVFENDLKQHVEIVYTPYDSANEKKDINDILITDGNNVRQNIYGPTGQIIGSFFPKVTRDDTWDDGWTGAGDSTGTDGGWKVEFMDARDANGTLKPFTDLTGVTAIRMSLLGGNFGGTNVNINLLPQDRYGFALDNSTGLLNVNTWFTQGKSQHTGGITLQKGQSQLFTGLADIRNGIYIDAYGSDNGQYKARRKTDTSELAVGRPIIGKTERADDSTAGWLREMIFQVVAVDATGAVILPGATTQIDWTKCRLFFSGTKGSDAPGQANTEKAIHVSGLDIKEVL